MYNIILGVFYGMLIYSTIMSILMVTNIDEDTMLTISVGIIGWSLILILKCVKKLLHWKEFHNRRSIILVKETNEKKWCDLKDTDNIYLWHDGYKLINRYANKSEWINLNTFTKDEINNFKRNCDNCKYDKECKGKNIKCKTDSKGVVLEFSNFERK